MLGDMTSMGGGVWMLLVGIVLILAILALIKYIAK